MLAKKISITFISFFCNFAYSSPIDSLADFNAGKFEYKSYTPKSNLAYLREPLSSHREVIIPADLSFPKNIKGKVPAIILLHGSDGLSPGMYKFWQYELNNAGYATLLIDMFTPRGITETNSDQGAFSPSAQIVDAYIGLKLLATHPRIDANRISLSGRSRGGEVTFDAYWDAMKKPALSESIRFASFIPVYPGPICATRRRYDIGNQNSAPMLVITGDEDVGFGDPSNCLLYFEDLNKNSNANIKLIHYKGGYHGFDGYSKYHVLPVEVFGKCRLEIDMLNPKNGRDFQTGETFSGIEEFYKRRTQCAEVGRKVGGNDALRNQLKTDVVDFLNSVR